MMSTSKQKVDDLFSDSHSFSSPIASKNNKRSEEGDKMKIKLMEKWNNFKYEMSEGAVLKTNSPLWLLGKCYHIEQSVELSSQEFDATKERQNKSKRPTHIGEFFDDFASKPWFTYRKGFPPFHGTTLTSDTGWGCMIRTSQMMICQGLVTHFLGRDWRWLLMQPKDLLQKRRHRMVMQWFIDEPNRKCPFSIHQLTEIGLTYKYKPGDWYGPSTMAYIMQDAMECGKGRIGELDDIVVYVAQDCAVYTKDVRDVCHWDKPSPDRSVIILIPIRLGESVMNPIYIPCIRGLFKLNHCIGIVGGKPKHSLYFVGIQDDYLIYLDPHYSQMADNLQSFSSKHLENYHSLTPRKMHISKIDPSCCLGFYCKGASEFESFVTQATEYLSPPKLETTCSLYLIAQGSARDHKYETTSASKTKATAIDAKSLTEEADSTATSAESFQYISEQIESQPDESIASKTIKSDKLSFSLSKPKEFLTNLYKQQLSPKSSKSVSLEEEFEIL